MRCPRTSHAAAVQGFAPGVVEQLAGELRLPGAGDALAEEHLADQGELPDRLEAFQEADLGVHVRLQPESRRGGPTATQGTDSDAVDQAGVRHPGTPCPAWSTSLSRAVVRDAANAAIRVEW